MSDKQTHNEKHNQPQRYKIRIKGTWMTGGATGLRA